MPSPEDEIRKQEEVDDLEQLKENLSEIGKRLACSGKIIANRVHAIIGQAWAELDENTLVDEDYDPEDEKIDTGDAEASDGAAGEPMQNGTESESTALTENPAGQQEASLDIDAEISRIEKALVNARAKEKTKANNKTSAPRASTSTQKRPYANRNTMRIQQRRTKNSMPLILTALITAALTIGMTNFIRGCEPESPTYETESSDSPTANNEKTESKPMPIRKINLTIEVKENFIFSKYDIRAEIDEIPLGTVQHGAKKSMEVELTEGYHDLLLYKPDDKEVVGEMEIEVQENTPIYLVASCSSTGISIDQLTTEEIEGRYIDELEQTANQPGMTAKTVIDQLKKLEYSNKGYMIRCYEQGKELEDFNQAEFDVSEGSVDGGNRVIKLVLVSNVPIEVSYPKEVAQRVALVATTNCYATDVFTEDGTAHDPSKFHSYADMAGYYLTLLSEGNWQPIDESTWHVEDMQLKKAGDQFYFVFSGDISQSGNQYAVKTASISYANSLNDATSMSGSAGADKLTAGDSTPYLTVDQELISADRDMDAERAATDAEASARAEREEYEKWVDSQFSFFSGRCDQLVAAVKSSLNDERSFRHIDTNYIVCDDEDTLTMVNNALTADGLPLANLKDIYVVMDFSAKNGFNATRKHQAHAIIRHPSSNVEVLTIL